MEILLRREKTNNKYNSLLLDLDGIQRWRVLTEVVRRMAVGEAPDPLPIQQVIGLNAEALLVDPLDGAVRYSQGWCRPATTIPGSGWIVRRGCCTILTVVREGNTREQTLDRSRG